MTTPSTMAASSLCLDVLTAARTPLHTAHRVEAAWLLSHPGVPHGVSLVTPRAVLLPQSLLMPALPSGTPAVSIGDGALWYDDQPVTVSRWFTPNRVARGGLSRHPTAPGRADDYLECWGDQLGAGEGLTPYGDDVICGVMLGLIAADDRAADSLAAQIRAADLESRTTAVSAALLRCACDGWCIPEIARVLEALASRRDPGAAVQRLLAVGHTSGEGLLAGLATVLDLRRPGLAA